MQVHCHVRRLQDNLHRRFSPVPVLSLFALDTIHNSLSIHQLEEVEQICIKKNEGNYNHTGNKTDGSIFFTIKVPTTFSNFVCSDVTHSSSIWLVS